jgi:hypothetical protein
VRDPGAVDRAGQPTCTDSAAWPSVDAVIGTFAVAGALGGELADRLSSHPVDHYELIIGLPLLAAGITYLVSASHGTDDVERCREIKEGTSRGCDGCPAELR